MSKDKIQIPIGANSYFNLKLVPNQKVITVKKKNSKSYILDINSNKQAMRDLSLAAYVLYMHFALSLPNYTEALSMQNLIDSTALSERTYYSAVKELIQKQYLVHDEKTEYKHHYFFYEESYPIYSERIYSTKT